MKVVFKEVRLVPKINWGGINVHTRASGRVGERAHSFLTSVSRGSPGLITGKMKRWLVDRYN
jgi:hypothetical protein